MSRRVTKSPLPSVSSSGSDSEFRTSAGAAVLPPLLRLADRFGLDRHLVACLMCEFFCSFFLMYGGAAINLVQMIQSRTSHEYNFVYGIANSWGLWLIMANYLGSQLSGPHMNPAFSLLFYYVGQIDFRRFILYSVMQYLGFFSGSLLCFLIYYDAINDFDGGVRQVRGPNATAGAFGTYPRDYLSVSGAFCDQLATTALLALVVLALTDERNKVPKGAQPALVGLALWCIVSMWSHNCGAALNPARDFGPRLMTFMVGYGWEVFSYNNYTWFWIPMVAPMFGSVLGALVYNLFIGDLLIVNDLSSAESREFQVQDAPLKRTEQALSIHKPALPPV